MQSCQSKKSKEPVLAGNPVFEGWYADPEVIIFDDTYWIYPTFSDEYEGNLYKPELTEHQKEVRENTINPQYLKQTFMDAFSSKDLVNWEKHPQVLSVENVKWAGYALWAPSIIKKGDKYYLFFGANDIQNDDQPGGIGMCKVYHRRPLTTTDGNHRETCIDRMYFDEEGFIKPVKITNEGVEMREIPVRPRHKR